MTLSIPEFWLGTDSSLALVLEARDRYLSDPSKYPPRMPQAKLYDGDEDEVGDDEEYDPIDENIQIENGVGILTISGPLVAQESPYDHWFGILSYQAVSRGVIKLAQKYEAGDIHSIIHVWDTNGGSAEGISGLSETMDAAGKMAPRTSSYTSSKAFSAGYWGAVTNPTFYAAPMAEVGSVGVITVAPPCSGTSRSGASTTRWCAQGLRRPRSLPTSPSPRRLWPS